MPIMLSIGEKWNHTVPFAMLNEDWAQRNHGQSLQRLAERGGLGPDEAIAIIGKRQWEFIPTEEALKILALRLARHRGGKGL
jgi:hypothetical protein